MKAASFLQDEYGFKSKNLGCVFDSQAHLYYSIVFTSVIGPKQTVLFCLCGQAETTSKK